MIILITCAGFPPAYLGGGPIRTVAAMLEHASTRHETWVLTNNFDHGSREPLLPAQDSWIQIGRSKVRYLGPGPLELYRGIRDGMRVKPDVVYLNSLFYPRLSVLLQLLSLASRTKVVIAPRGELDPGALALKTRKKRAFLAAFKAVGLNRRVIWHASTDLEKGHVKKVMGEGSRIVVRENDTLLPAEALRPTSIQPGILKAVFLSRISPKKGLDIALRALQHVDTAVKLDVVGPPEDAEYMETCQRLAVKLPDHVRVRFLGPVVASEIRNLLSEYDVMLFPTAGENFGHVIAESLSVACPVMCSDTTPWSMRLREGAGVVVDEREPVAWARAIEEYASVSPPIRHERRLAAAAVFEEWIAENQKDSSPHFFDLLEGEVETSELRLAP